MSFTYPNSDTLKNKAGITDYDQLEREVAESALARSIEIGAGHGPAPTFDQAHLQALHKHLFQDVFEWAGELRHKTFTFADGSQAATPAMHKKGGKDFAIGNQIDRGLDGLMSDLKAQNYLRGLDRDTFTNEAADAFARLNSVPSDFACCPPLSGRFADCSGAGARLLPLAGQEDRFAEKGAKHMPKHHKNAAANGPRTDVYERITSKIIEQLEQGVRPWMQPWGNGTSPIRPLRHNGIRYQGINTVLLWMEAAEKGYNSAYWMTYKQAQELGAQVTKGSKSALVVYAGAIEREEEGPVGSKLGFWPS